MNDFYFDTIMETMPEYYSTETHMCIRTKDRLIEILFPKKWVEYFQRRYGFKSLEDLSFNMMQKLFLYAIGDFSNNCISIEEASAICLKMWESKKENASDEEKILFDLMHKCIEMSYYVRTDLTSKSSSSNFSLCYRDIFKYYKKYLDEIAQDHLKFNWDNYKEEISNRPEYNKSKYFGNTQVKEINLPFTQQQKAFLLLLRDFLAGEITTTELANWVPNSGSNLENAENKEEKELYDLFFYLVDGLYDLMKSGSNILFENAINYYKKHEHLLAK